MAQTSRKRRKRRKRKRRRKKRSERKKRELRREKRKRLAHVTDGIYILTCEYPMKMELWAGDVCVKVGMKADYQRELRLGNQYKEHSEIVRFSYYAEGFGATQDRYERPKPARIKTNKLKEGKSTTMWSCYLCQLGITEVPDSTHTIPTRSTTMQEVCSRHHWGGIYKWWVLLATYHDYGWSSNGLSACGWICELMLRWATNQY